ncbi:MAG: DUF420 domain-containing protein [Bacteroidia bacterium]
MKTIKPNDKLARIIILSLSIVVFSLVVLMRKVKFEEFDFGFDTHVFPAISAFLNSIVSILLVIGLVFIKLKKPVLHRNSMLVAVLFSIFFLITYVLYHFTTEETLYGGEGTIKVVYLILLFSHIVLAGLILPFILYSVYRGLTGEYAKHKKLTRWVWPIWFYVSITGVIVYFMISPYY